MGSQIPSGYVAEHGGVTSDRKEAYEWHYKKDAIAEAKLHLNEGTCKVGRKDKWSGFDKEVK